MIYLVAKKINEIGCIALQTEIGDKLASLSRYLTLASLDKGVEIITLSDPNTFNEYAPYTIINDELEFINKVLQM